jgi:hypothetical protein
MAAPPTNIFLDTPCIHVTIETWQNLQHQNIIHVTIETLQNLIHHTCSYFDFKTSEKNINPKWATKNSII